MALVRFVGFWGLLVVFSVGGLRRGRVRAVNIGGRWRIPEERS